jgi:hypothetical protein
LLFTYPARHTALRPLPNRVLHIVVVLGFLLQIAAGTLPLSIRALGLSGLSFQEWAIVLAAAPGAWAVAELLNRLFWPTKGTA